MAGTRAPAAAPQTAGTDYGPTIPDPDEARARLGTLTRSEGEVLAQLARGWTVSEIAAHRFVSVATIRTQLKDINRTLGVHSVVEAVVTVYRAGGTQHCGPRPTCVEAASNAALEEPPTVDQLVTAICWLCTEMPINWVEIAISEGRDDVVTAVRLAQAEAAS